MIILCLLIYGFHGETLFHISVYFSNFYFFIDFLIFQKKEQHKKLWLLKSNLWVNIHIEIIFLFVVIFPLSLRSDYQQFLSKRPILYDIRLYNKDKSLSYDDIKDLWNLIQNYCEDWILIEKYFFDFYRVLYLFNYYKSFISKVQTILLYSLGLRIRNE